MGEGDIARDWVLWIQNGSLVVFIVNEQKTASNPWRSCEFDIKMFRYHL